MKKLFTFVLPALFVLMATSCKPSLEGRWHYVKTECYVDGKWVDVDDEQEDYIWFYDFNDDGTGYNYNDRARGIGVFYNVGYSFYWKLVDGKLYMDDEPIRNITERQPAWIVKSLDRKELRVAGDIGEDRKVYVFRKK